MQQASARIAETIGELKFGQIGIANLKLRVCDPTALRIELEQKVATAPQLFSRAPLVLDLSRLSNLPNTEQVRALLESVQAAGMLPVGLSYGTSENEALARSLNLPLFAKFRAAFERTSNETPAMPTPTRKQQPELAPLPSEAIPAVGSSLHHAQPVRSGQQVYARGRDLTLTTMVGNGAEVIADGSIHIYGRLSGRALAGAQGDTAARIYCQDFQAELISIAGHYRVFEDISTDLRGKPVQAWLEDGKLLLAHL